jgi:replicative DNA helicase
VTDPIQTVLAAGREQVLAALDRLAIDPMTLPRLPWDALTNVVGPIWPTDIWLVAAGTGSGKTTVLAHCAEHFVASRRRIYVLALEQSPNELRTAMAALALGYHPQWALVNAWTKLGTGAEAKIRAELKRQVSELEGRLIFSPSETLTVHDLEFELATAASLGADLVLIDHLGQVDVGGYEGLRTFLKELKRAINAVQIPVLMAAQLGRGDRDILRPYRPPTSYDLEGGEVIAQIASVILGLYRPVMPMTVGDEREVRRGSKSIREFVVPHAIGVTVMKHRVGGDVLGERILLHYERGRISDPVTEQRLADEVRYGL